MYIQYKMVNNSFQTYMYNLQKLDFDGCLRLLMSSKLSLLGLRLSGTIWQQPSFCQLQFRFNPRCDVETLLNGNIFAVKILLLVVVHGQ